MKIIGIVFMLITAIESSNASSWSQTLEEKELFSIAKEKFGEKRNKLFEKCSPQLLGTYIIARSVDTPNHQLRPCDRITQVTFEIKGKKNAIDYPVQFDLMQISDAVKSDKTAVVRVVFRRGTEQSEMALSQKDGKFGLMFVDKGTEKIKLMFGVTDPTAVQKICKDGTWVSCFFGIPWGATYGDVEALLVHTWHKNEKLKAFFLKEASPDINSGIDDKYGMYQVACFVNVSKDVDNISDNCMYELGFLAIGQNRFALVSGTEKINSGQKILMDDFHKAFKAKHGSSKENDCEQLTCRALYSKHLIVSRFRSGVVTNTAYTLNSEILDAYKSYKVKIDNQSERKQLLQEIQKKNGLEGLL